MFTSDFYPTPEHVLNKMQIDATNKIVLEPSAGMGNIVDYVKRQGAKQVLTCEITEQFLPILREKSQVIGTDFLKITADRISHVNLIVMNPPFRTAADHILHAYDIAPAGCEIIALCNYNTLSNAYTQARNRLAILVDTYGFKQNLKDVFSDAERQTQIDVGLINIFKPFEEENEDFENFYTEADEYDTPEQDGVIRFDEIKAVVNSYISAIKIFKKVENLNDELKAATNLTFIGKEIKDTKEDEPKFETHCLNVVGRINTTIADGKDGVYTAEQFSKEYQKACWNYIFNRIGIEKYVTTQVKEEITKFIEIKSSYPFTVRNVHKMIEIIIGTRSQIMDRAIVEAVDNFTKYTHENRYGLEGWKTNEGHLLAPKFIINYSVDTFRGYYKFKYPQARSNTMYLQDLLKALCMITGQNYDDQKTVWDYSAEKTNTWYEWNFFNIKVFKKGTAHIEFKDRKVWETLNRRYAKIKGNVLPEKL